MDCLALESQTSVQQYRLAAQAPRSAPRREQETALQLLLKAVRISQNAEVVQAWLARTMGGQP
jgi:hypothetical protein